MDCVYESMVPHHAKGEVMNLIKDLFWLGFVILLLLGLSSLAKAQRDDRTREIYPTLPGTSIRDYSQPGWIVVPEGRKSYSTDPTSRSYRLRNETNIYPTIPGTSMRDFSKPGFKVKED